MKRPLLFLASLAASGAAPAATSASPDAPVASVVVARSGNRWSADYRLAIAAPVWVFAKSHPPLKGPVSWRVPSVRVLTPGVRLERIGDYDALVADGGAVPARVRLAFTPVSANLEGSYDPALLFTDGAVALYADAFRVLPLPSAAVAAKAPRDSDLLPGVARPTRMTFRDGGSPILYQGRRVDRVTTDDGDAYLLFGKATPLVGPALTTVIDPALPAWLATFLRTEIPAILQSYQRALGPAPVGRPTLLVSWAGPTPHLISMGGSVLSGMVVMRLEGIGVVKPSAQLSSQARWFAAHESAHFWLGQAIAYSRPEESWITEGGAELLAFRATAAADPHYDIHARLREARDECVPYLAHGGIEAAYQRTDDFRAYYACGVILALVAEKAAGGDFGRFVRTLIARHGAQKTVNRREWLALVEELGAPRGDTAAIADLLDKGHPDGKAALDGFIAATGIGPAFATPAT
ncbi:hypothetical protein HMF7854_03060 [Sphingomonas ginkgonis]|uniref:Peptidase M1 membrane alanine aminopeptidase domain-containing protein n=1 Tax=Sphingomonas ginkgonis TaxID=2315330 RepID=A0A3R9Y4C7_9SPHN|nr:hypothetical protein [Sphingomonas ginkgonis]RST29915.1 hypothetical protein HMF7854_03060 [Sphingomonas ginkgonis]